jgi:hypothetical protein
MSSPAEAAIGAVLVTGEIPSPQLSSLDAVRTLSLII